MDDENRRKKVLDDLNEGLRLGRHYTEYDTDALRALRVLHRWLGIYDSQGTATYAELLAEEALSTLFAHIDSAELANRLLNQDRTRQRAIQELAEEL